MLGEMCDGEKTVRWGSISISRRARRGTVAPAPVAH